VNKTVLTINCTDINFMGYCLSHDRIKNYALNHLMFTEVCNKQIMHLKKTMHDNFYTTKQYLLQ